MDKEITVQLRFSGRSVQYRLDGRNNDVFRLMFNHDFGADVELISRNALSDVQQHFNKSVLTFLFTYLAPVAAVIPYIEILYCWVPTTWLLLFCSRRAGSLRTLVSVFEQLYIVI